MSWSIAFKGTKEDAKKNLELQSRSPLQSYAGKTEGDDVKAGLDRAHALIDAIALTDEFNGVSATAYGSHTTYPEGISEATLHVSVTRVKLEKK